MRQTTTMAALVAAALLGNQAEAFWGKGHLIVARRAQEILETEAASATMYALEELDTLNKNHPGMIEHEKDHPFTECATFADDIKETWGNWQTPWHFIDQPYLDEPGTTVEDFPDFVLPDVNVVDALTDLTAFMKREVDSSNSKYIREIAEYFPVEEDQRSFSLRLIIHYLGDIHQPLHGVSEVDSRFSAGDQGGNAQKVPLDEASGVGDLHAIWDSVIYEYPGYETMPFDAQEWSYYSEQAMKLHKAHPVDQELIFPGQFATWSKEGLDLAISTVYKGFEPNQPASKEYLAAARPKIEERMMFGGRRLAELIKDIYSDKVAAESETEEQKLFLQ